MIPVVAIDKGDHWHVIGDYGGSRTVKKLTEAQWKQVYAGDSFKDMRESQPTSVAMLAPKGSGFWLKDWSAPYIPPAPPETPQQQRRRELKDKMKSRTATLPDIQEYLAGE